MKLPHASPLILMSLVILLGLAGCRTAPTPERPRLQRTLGPILTIFDTAARPGRKPAVPRGTYPLVETSFQLPEITTNSFAADIWADIEKPTGNHIRVPAFYDGDNTWRVRYTPDCRGEHRMTISGRAADRQPITRLESLATDRFTASGEPGDGFIRCSPTVTQQFVYDSGRPYYPLGFNIGWGDAEEYEYFFMRMRESRMNWTRIWMPAWAPLNLDWQEGKDLEIGQLDLEVARTWDRIIRDAEENGVHIQMVLQHHGQFSTNADPDWPKNPWNVANGGFLAEADDFFTDERAKALVKIKYRYIVARWGYSQAVMAWELFNEINFADVIYHGKHDLVTQWHDEMADYLHAIDPFRHPVTTSCLPLPHPSWRKMDYYQPHGYAADMVAELSRYELDISELDKPCFYGEVGVDQIPAKNKKDENFFRSSFWAGMMADGAGPAQLWYWDLLDKMNFYRHYRVARQLVEDVGLDRRHFTALPIRTESADTVPILLVPGLNWARTTNTEVVIPNDNSPIEGMELMSPYIHGALTKRLDGFPGQMVFHISSDQPTTITLNIGEVAAVGAGLRLYVDLIPIVWERWPKAEKDTIVEEPIIRVLPAGKHKITVASTGADWIRMRSFSFAHHNKPALGCFGKSDGDGAALLWVYNSLGLHVRRPRPVEGKIHISGLQPGAWRVTWIDTETGKPLGRDATHRTTSDGVLTLVSPPIPRDAAVTLKRKGK